MYRLSYNEILEESSNECRERERMAFERIIEMLGEAQAHGPMSVESAKAIAFVQRLWSLLIEDLLNQENGLPEKLRAEIISIGLWIMKESELIRRGESQNYKGLIDINKIICDGLK